MMVRTLVWSACAFLALGGLAALAAAVWLGGRIAAAFCAWRRSWKKFREDDYV